jgi:hypothetical protein
MPSFKRILKSSLEPGVMVQACNSSTAEVETGRSRVQGQPGLYSRTLSQKNKPKQQQKELVGQMFVMVSETTLYRLFCYGNSQIL